MAFSSLLFLQVTVVLFLLSTVSSERMKGKIYDSIDGVAACFRRLNGTHQFGCTSRRSGNVGIVHIVGNLDDLNWLLTEGKAIPYMVVLYPDMFRRDVLIKLKDSGKINGIALVNNGTYPQTFSHEDTCPNRYSGLSSFSTQTCGMSPGEPEWNPDGTKLMMADWGFPIFYVHSDLQKIENCYNSFNSEGRNMKHNTSLCAMEMNSFMFATTDSATCIRRSKMITNFNPMKFCDPLGGRNVWSTLFPRNNSNMQNKTMFVVSSRLDTSSLFDGIAPGAVSPVTGIVTLLTAAHILAKMTDSKDVPQPQKNVFFVLFNGESYDYIGSSRMLWDMQKGRFPSEDDSAGPPLRLEHLAYFIELSHITNKNNTLVFHTKDVNSVQSRLSAMNFTGKMEKFGKKLGLKFQLNKNGSLPPASLQTFKAQSAEVDGVVIADYLNSYQTSYYHSIFDDSRGLDYDYHGGDISPSGNLIQTFVANVSIALAQTLYEMLYEKPYEAPFDKTNETATVHLVDELFHCYLDEMNCSIFQQVAPNAILSDEAGSLYVGVNSWRGPNYHVTTLTGHTLAYLTGSLLNKTEKECQNDLHHPGIQYIWMKGEDGEGVCVNTTMNFSIASSPAFEEEDYDWSSGLYSTWTESVWQELTVRVFLKPSPSHEATVLSIGAVVFVLSFIIVYFLNSRSHILFGNTLGTGAC